MSARGRALAGVLVPALLAGCGGTAGGARSGPPTVTVQAGGEDVALDPTQYCLDGEGQRYPTVPPILEVVPGTTVVLTVPAAVAEAGWSVQVFDEGLEQLIGEVDVPEGADRFDEISTSDVVPPTFYLVVVQDSDPDACSNLAGAWPVGFVRNDAPAAPPS